MKMYFNKIKASYSCYPRVNHAYKHAQQLAFRFDDIKNKSAFKQYFSSSTGTTCKINSNKPEFVLYLQTSEKGSNFERDDVLQRKERLIFIGSVECNTIRDIFRNHDYVMEPCVVLITKEIVSDKNAIVVSERNEEIEETSGCLKPETISDRVCKLLEQHVFKIFGMKEKCEFLNESLSEYRENTAQRHSIIVGDDASQSRKGFEESLVAAIPCKKIVEEKEGTHKSRSESENESKLCCTNISNGTHRNHVKQKNTSTDVSFNHSDNLLTIPSQNKRPRSGDNVCVNGRSSFGHMGEHDRLQGRATTTEIYSRQNTEPTQPNISKKLRTDENVILEREVTSQSFEKSMCAKSQNVELIELVDKIERLSDEMMGMFARSRLPQHEKPNMNVKFDGIVGDALKQDLGQISTSIRSCGYRCSTFVVFVDDECDLETLKPAIKRILKKHNILNFDVVSTGVKELSSCNVGSTVAAHFDDVYDKCGTLGGFARATSDEVTKTICLVSRHVVTDTNGNPASELKVLNDGNATDASVMIDKSFRDNRKIVLDIAAASFKGDERQFDTKYKTSEEQAATGTLSEYSQEELKGLPVHICGSKTSIGFGTITVPKLEGVQDSSMNDFIIIEDTENPRQKNIPFCEEGDSGAIVCADDQDNPDHVQLISMVIGENVKKKGNYYSLNLKEGVKQVKEEIKANNIQLL